MPITLLLCQILNGASETIRGKVFLIVGHYLLTSKPGKMKKTTSHFLAVLFTIIMTVFMFSGCKKEPQPDQQFNLDVTLKGGKSTVYLKFTQNPDPAKIIELDIKVHNLSPNHGYLLQRAVDEINVADGNCTSTSWLTLGKGLTPQSIFTDGNGDGEVELWRDVTSIATGAIFDIHFQVIDAVNSQVVLVSDCYKYTVR